MSRLIGALLAVAGLASVAVGYAAVLGLGVLRDVDPWAASCAAVALSLLPALGLASLGRLHPLACAVAFWGWPLALLHGLPMYFPGERAEAIVTGVAWLALPFGGTSRGAALGEQIAGWLGEEGNAGSPPRVAAEAPPPPPPSPPPRALEADEVVLPYEGQGRSLRIPVDFSGPRGEEELWMLFDTGATFTTLDEASLRLLGAQVPADAPEVTLHTAGGARQAKLVLLEKVWLGGFAVEGVTIAVCEACASDDARGLLGLNVSGQFQVTLDHDRQEMVLAPRSGASDRKLDVGQWVDVKARVTAWPDGRRVVELRAQNRASRRVSEAVVAIGCEGQRYTVPLQSLPAGGLKVQEAKLPRELVCEGDQEYEVSLDSAVW